MAQFGNKSKKTQVEKILVLLVDSGVLYSLICATSIVFDLIDLPGHVFVIQWTWPIMTHVAGVDHTIILLLIAFKRTICTLPNDYNQVTLPDIQFRSASGVVQTTGEHHQMSDIRQTSPNTEV